MEAFSWLAVCWLHSPSWGWGNLGRKSRVEAAGRTTCLMGQSKMKAAQPGTPVHGTVPTTLVPTNQPKLAFPVPLL